MDQNLALQLRDPVADTQRLSERLDFFRDRKPVPRKRPIEEEHLQQTWGGNSRLPEIEASNFNARVLRSAIATSGSLIVRGLLQEYEAKHLRFVIDSVVERCSEIERENGDPTAAYDLYRCSPAALKSLLSAHDLRMSRHFHRASGSAMCVEAASVAEQLLEVYSSLGLKEIIAQYLDEPPCLSALKWVLRRSKLPVEQSGWHQDGAFMGEEINSLNMWMPLSDCGGHTGSPGLDVVPLRLRKLFETGRGAATFDWSVSEEKILEHFGDEIIESPVFKAGDAFFFDHFYLHRTQYRLNFSKPRYAIETWFFGSINFPHNQIPLMW